jgi:hypothetical protein
MAASRKNVNPCNSKSVWYDTTAVNVHVRLIFHSFLLHSCRTEDVFMGTGGRQVSRASGFILLELPVPAFPGARAFGAFCA